MSRNSRRLFVSDFRQETNPSTEKKGRGASRTSRMDFSGTQGELPMPMHAGGGSPYHLGLRHDHDPPPHHQHHHGGGGANGRHASPPEAEAEEELEEAKSNRQQALAVVPLAGVGGGGVRYRECLKNHAAAIGGSATDGCGDFMPAGEDGSLDALRCSACGCHRNFHRKEPLFPGSGGGAGRGPPPPPLGLHHHHLNAAGVGGPLSPIHPHHHHRRGLLVAALPPAPTRMVMPLSAAMQHHHGHATSAESDQQAPGQPPARKRFRTKFTAEQKARMLGFAEEAGWRLQKLEDDVVQRFCNEVGVKRRVLKVWMHNNKHTLATRRDPPPGPPGYGGGGGDGEGLGMPHPEPGGPGRSPSRSRSPPPPPLHHHHHHHQQQQQQLRLE